MGSDFFETPHLDRMASQGTVFTNAYSCAANCAPARACLLSGQYTPRHRIFNVGTGPRGKAKFRRLMHEPGTQTLSTSLRTWAHQLQAAGYKTASIGKWHLSDDPCDYGFDQNVGGTHGGSPPNGYYPPHLYRGKVPPGLEDASDDAYLTDRLSDAAVDFIHQNSDQPWCLYLTHYAVHTPLNAKKELLTKYRSKRPGDLHSHVAMATMIQAVDDGVGRIEATLVDLQLTDKTVVIFYSDNGGLAAATDMRPLRGHKGTFYEGGIREPFFVRWPGVVSAGTKRTDPIIGVDILPTLCEIANAPLPRQPLDGVSLVPLLRGEILSLPSRDLFWHFPAYLQATKLEGRESRDPLFRTRPCSVIRSGVWKLHHYLEDDGLELYDLSKDLGESNNLATTLPGKAAELKRRLDMWCAEIDAPVSLRRNPSFDAQAELAAIRAAMEPN